MIDWKTTRRVYFVGLGGIGVSALARLMLAEGKEVFGSDRSASALTEELKQQGATVFYDHRPENLPLGADLLVIYSSAIPLDNPELVEAKRRGLLTLTYPEMLGAITEGKYLVAVAGTHGKTTTTAMLGEIMIDAGLDPTVIVGGLLRKYHSNFLPGRGQYFLVEACEYRRAFLNLSPRVLIITNIDNDHLDYYRDLVDIRSAFAELAVRVPPEGFLVFDFSDEGLRSVAAAARCQLVDYRSIAPPPRLPLPGNHNLLNARAALAAAGVLGIGREAAEASLSRFGGTGRRFEPRGKTPWGAEVYDDYAHHPTEIKAVLQAAGEVARGKIFVVFQPHLYSRTCLLFNEFATSFRRADEVLVTEIYAAREAPPEKEYLISGRDLASAIAASGTPAVFVADFVAAAEHLRRRSRRGDFIITLGAGDICLLAQDLV